MPPDLEQLVLSCLEKEPEGRPQSAADVGRRSPQLVSNPGPTLTRSMWAARPPAMASWTGTSTRARRRRSLSGVTLRTCERVCQAKAVLAVLLSVGGFPECQLSESVSRVFHELHLSEVGAQRLGRGGH